MMAAQVQTAAPGHSTTAVTSGAATTGQVLVAGRGLARYSGTASVGLV